MKKILTFLALGIFSLGFSQYYPSTGRTYDNYNGWYADDSHYFPDDYYYEYPYDYYTDDYYRSFYNDYRRSLTMVNWNRFFRDMSLNPWQIDMILELNSQFPSFYVWNDYYRSNPNRWYYDRYYALERILGSRIFRIFQTRYYNGYSPVRYYVNYWRNYYKPRYYSYYVVPRYRQVNVNVYHVNKYDYHRTVGNKYGWTQPRNPHNPGGLVESRTNNNTVSSQRTGTANQSNSNAARTGGFRNDSQSVNRNSQINTASSITRSTGMRNEPRQPVQNRTMSAPAPQQRVQSGTRSDAGGFRSVAPQPRTESRSVQQSTRSSQMRSGSDSGTRSSSASAESRSSGLRSGGLR